MPGTAVGHINTYLIRGDSKYLLIDTGWNTAEAFDALKKQLAEIGARFKDISQIIITHVHPDHYGLAGRLKQLSRAKIAVHHLEKDLIDARYINMADLLTQLAYSLQINGVPASDLFQLQTASVDMIRWVTPTLPDATLRGGETFTFGSFSFQALWTPGHSPGHICLYEPQQKVLFSGDHILPNITPNIGLHPQSGPDPLNDYLNSLSAMRQLDTELVLPGHEQPFTGLEPRIEQIIQHHQARSQEILRILNTTPKTAYQLATEITWMRDAGSVKWDDLKSWDKRMAVSETLSHLEAMRTDGKLDKLTRDGIIYYQYR